MDNTVENQIKSLNYRKSLKHFNCDFEKNHLYNLGTMIALIQNGKKKLLFLFKRFLFI